jgi:hypothetical protein
MFQINDDNSIYITRGDIAVIDVSAVDKDNKPYMFSQGDLLRIKVFAKKNCENVVLERDFPVTTNTDKVTLYLDENDTKIGGVISKPVDYWYEVELNPLSNPQTIIGYGEDGAALFKLFPEGRDLEEIALITLDDIPNVDEELDLTSTRPVANGAVTKAVERIKGDVKGNAKKVEELKFKTTSDKRELKAEIAVERARMDNIVTAETVDNELVDMRVGANGETYSSAGTAVREQIREIKDNYAVGVKSANVFNIARAQINKYVSYGSGKVGDANGFFVTDIIPVVSGEKYYAARYLSDRTAILPITEQQVAFYNIAGEYLSGVEKNEYPINVPQNASYMRMSGKAEYINEFFIGQTTPLYFEPYGNMTTNKTTKGFVVDYDAISLPVVTGQRSPNIINPAKLFKNRYVHYAEGKSGVLEGFCHTDFIDLSGHTKIYAYGASAGTGHTQTSFYDETFSFLGGVHNLTVEGIDIPDGAKYARITLPLENKIMVTFDELVANFIPYGAYVDSKSNETIITVGKGKQFTSLRQAVRACSNPSPDNRYVIEFYGDGTAYDVMSDYTEAEKAGSGFIGLVIPAYTTLRGMGNRANNILTCSIESPSISTLNTTTSASLENLTLYGENCRYVVHADYRDHNNAEGHMYNCHMVGKNLSYQSVCGTGLWSGAKWHIKDCVFEHLSNGVCFSTHNNVNFEKPATIEFENCRMKTTRDYGVRISSLNTDANGIVNRIKIVGCKTGGILLIEENASQYGAGILFEVTGYGNDVKTAMIQNTDGKDYSSFVDMI